MTNKTAPSPEEGQKPAKLEKKRPSGGGPWLSTEEAADYIGAAVGTLINWRSCNTPGKPLGIKPGRHVWYSQAELDAYLARAS